MDLLGPIILGIAMAALLYTSTGISVRIVRKDGKPMRVRDYAIIISALLLLCLGIAGMIWASAGLSRELLTRSGTK